jgi:hypothetical protein
MNDSNPGQRQVSKTPSENDDFTLVEPYDFDYLRKLDPPPGLFGPGEVTESYDLPDGLMFMDILYVFLAGRMAQIWPHDAPEKVIELRAPEMRVRWPAGPSKSWTLRLPDRTAIFSFVTERDVLRVPTLIKEEHLAAFSEEQRRQVRPVIAAKMRWYKNAREELTRLPRVLKGDGFYERQLGGL